MKKLLSIVLAVVMLLGCMSIPAFAAETYELSNGEAALYFSPHSADAEASTEKLIYNYKAFIIDHAFEGVQDFVESNVSAIIEGTASGYSGKFNLSGYYGTSIFQYIVPAEYYDGDSNAVPGNAETAICVVFYYANGFESAPTHYEAICFDTEQHLFDDQGSVEATEWKVLPAEEPAEEGKSGNTDITLTVAKSLTYDMVIPEDVTNLNAAGIYSVGQAKVENVENATDNTVISYTASTTAFKCEGKTDIPASYYTEQAATNAFPTDAVTVYENNADAASIPTMWVKIAEEDWNAAENGTYTATVTYNFSAEEVEKVTIADILPEDFPVSTELCWWKGGEDHLCDLYVQDGNLIAQYEDLSKSVPVATELTLEGDMYSCTVSGITWKFSVEEEENEFWRVNISGCSDVEALNGTYGEVG